MPARTKRCVQRMAMLCSPRWVTPVSRNGARHRRNRAGTSDACPRRSVGGMERLRSIRTRESRAAERRCTRESRHCRFAPRASSIWPRRHSSGHWRLRREMPPRITILAQLYDQTNEPARAVEHYRMFLDTAGAEHAIRACRRPSPDSRAVQNARVTMSEIDNLLQEDRRFPPPDAWTKSANITDPAVYERAARDPEAVLGRVRARARVDPAVGHGAASGRRRTRAGSTAARSTRAPTVSIGTSARRGGTRRRSSGKARPGDRRTLTYWDLLPAGQRVCQRAQVARRETRRSRRALPAADSRARHRDARLRAHRRDPQRRLRRLQRRVAARSDQRLAMRAARDRRRRLPPRPHRAA